MLRSMCSLKRKCKHVPKYLPLDLLCMHCNHNLLSQQCSPKHVRTGCDVIKTCWMGLSPASSMILLYKFAITLKAIYFGHSHVLLLHSPCVHRALSVHKIFANTNTHTHKMQTYIQNSTTKLSAYTHSATAAGLIQRGTPAVLRSFLPPSQSRHTDFKNLPLGSFSFHAITSESTAYFS